MERKRMADHGSNPGPDAFPLLAPVKNSCVPVSPSAGPTETTDPEGISK